MREIIKKYEPFFGEIDTIPVAASRSALDDLKHGSIVTFSDEDEVE